MNIRIILFVIGFMSLTQSVERAYGMEGAQGAKEELIQAIKAGDAKKTADILGANWGSPEIHLNQRLFFSLCYYAFVNHHETLIPDVLTRYRYAQSDSYNQTDEQAAELSLLATLFNRSDIAMHFLENYLAIHTQTESDVYRNRLLQRNNFSNESELDEEKMHSRMKDFIKRMTGLKLLRWTIRIGDTTTIEFLYDRLVHSASNKELVELLSQELLLALAQGKTATLKFLIERGALTENARQLLNRVQQLLVELGLHLEEEPCLKIRQLLDRLEEIDEERAMQFFDVDEDDNVGTSGSSTSEVASDVLTFQPGQFEQERRVVVIYEDDTDISDLSTSQAVSDSVPLQSEQEIREENIRSENNIRCPRFLTQGLVASAALVAALIAYSFN